MLTFLVWILVATIIFLAYGIFFAHSPFKGERAWTTFVMALLMAAGITMDLFPWEEERGAVVFLVALMSALTVFSCGFSLGQTLMARERVEEASNCI